MCDTLAQLALEVVCKQLAVAVSRHSPAQHGVLYLTTSSPRFWHVALHGTFLPPMSGDVGCLKFHSPMWAGISQIPNWVSPVLILA